MAYNKIILMGRLVRDPEIKQTSSGISIANFTLAMDRSFGDEKKTDFIPVVAFNGTADTIGKYVRKGQQLLVSGQLQQKSWEDKDGNKHSSFEVFAQEFSFCETKASDSTKSSTKQESFSTAKLEPLNGDDDLPF